LKAFVITIFGLPLSESGANLCIRSGAKFGLEIERFAATVRYQAEAVMKRHGLELNRRIYSSISDAPLGDRDTIAKGQWWLTTPELGCCMSHYRLWLHCLRIDEPIMILEHDAVFLGAVPQLPSRALAINLNHSAYADTIAYVLSPRAARRAVREAKKHGVQPSDELLWRSALKRQRIAVCNPPAVVPDQHGISTIQFTRDDHHHEQISKTDPWKDYRP